MARIDFLQKYDFYDIPFRKKVISFQDRTYRWVPLKEVIVGEYEDGAEEKNITLDNEYLVCYEPLYNIGKLNEGYWYNSIYRITAGQTIKTCLSQAYSTVLGTVFSDTNVSYLYWKAMANMWRWDNFYGYQLREDLITHKFSLRNYDSALYVKTEPKKLRTKLLTQLTI